MYTRKREIIPTCNLRPGAMRPYFWASTIWGRVFTQPVWQTAELRIPDKVITNSIPSTGLAMLIELEHFITSAILIEGNFYVARVISSFQC